MLFALYLQIWVSGTGVSRDDDNGTVQAESFVLWGSGSGLMQGGKTYQKRKTSFQLGECLLIFPAFYIIFSGED